MGLAAEKESLQAPLGAALAKEKSAKEETTAVVKELQAESKSNAQKVAEMKDKVKKAKQELKTAMAKLALAEPNAGHVIPLSPATPKGKAAAAEEESSEAEEEEKTPKKKAAAAKPAPKAAKRKAEPAK